MTNSIVPASTSLPIPTGAELLRGPSRRELHIEIDKLFTAFFDQQRPEAAKIAALYAQILSQFSAWSIKEGIRRVIEGEVEGVDRRFLPSTAVVAHTIRTVAENSPEAKERQWRRRLDAWRSGQEWNPHWAQDPESPSFPYLCPKHLLADFEEATRQRNAGKTA